MLFTPKHPLEIADQYGDTIYSGFIKIRDEFNDLCLSVTNGVNSITDGLADGSVIHLTPSAVIDDGVIKAEHLAEEAIQLTKLDPDLQTATTEQTCTPTMLAACSLRSSPTALARPDRQTRTRHGLASWVTRS